MDGRGVTSVKFEERATMDQLKSRHNAILLLPLGCKYGCSCLLCVFPTATLHVFFCVCLRDSLEWQICPALVEQEGTHSTARREDVERQAYGECVQTHCARGPRMVQLPPVWTMALTAGTGCHSVTAAREKSVLRTKCMVQLSVRSMIVHQHV